MENKKLTKKDYYGMLKDIILTSDVDNKEELEAFIDRQVEIIDNKAEKAKETTVKFVKDNADRAKEFYNKISKELDEHILAPLNKKIKELGNRMDNNSVGKYVMKGVRAICSAAQWIRTKAMDLSTGAYYSLHRVYRTARHKLGKDPKVKPQATEFRSQVDK